MKKVLTKLVATLMIVSTSGIVHAQDVSVPFASGAPASAGGAPASAGPYVPVSTGGAPATAGGAPDIGSVTPPSPGAN